MSNELATAAIASAAAQPSRTSIATLTLQLRAAQQEALVAERSAEDIQIEGDVAKLRARLGALLDARRAELDAELARAREESAAIVAGAHRAARAIVSRAAVAAPAVAVASVALPEPSENPCASGSDPEPFVETWISSAYRANNVDLASADLGGLDALDVSDAPQHAIDAQTASELLAGLSSSSDHPPVTAAATEPAAAPGAGVAGFDVQQMAAVFASVLATRLDEQMTRWAPAPPPPPKPSFRANALHLDVVLVGIITIVCVLVLLAWLG